LINLFIEKKVSLADDETRFGLWQAYGVRPLTRLSRRQ
jgi:hypothetical protein